MSTEKRCIQRQGHQTDKRDKRGAQSKTGEKQKLEDKQSQNQPRIKAQKGVEGSGGVERAKRGGGKRIT
jgi:hypothetical protein